MSFSLNPIELTLTDWRRVREKFARDGVDVPDEPSGRIVKDKVVAEFTWDGNTLRVEIKEKPFYYPQEIVRTELTKYIETA